MQAGQGPGRGTARDDTGKDASMNRTRRLIAATALLALATAGCAKADKPAWSFDTSAGTPGGGQTVASVATPAPAATAARIAVRDARHGRSHPRPRRQRPRRGSECGPVRAARSDRPGRHGGYGPRLGLPHDREGHHGRRGLRRPRLDVWRHRARSRRLRAPGRHGQRSPDEPGPDEPLHRLPRQPDRDEPPDGGDPAGRDVHLHLHRRLRRRLDVPLRHGADPPPHRQRHVRHGHRGAQGRAAQGGQRVRVRAGRVVPGCAG